MKRGLTAHQLKIRSEKLETERRKKQKRYDRRAARVEGATVPQEKDRWPANWPKQSVRDALLNDADLRIV